MLTPLSFAGMESETQREWPVLVPELDFTVDDCVPRAGLSLSFLSTQDASFGLRVAFQCKCWSHPALSVELAASVEGRIPGDRTHGPLPCLTQRTVGHLS